LITSMVSLGAGVGPLMAGAIYDTTGNYDAFLLAGTVGLVLSGLMFLTLPRYPDWDERAKGALQPA
jgi:MFS family permease